MFIHKQLASSPLMQCLCRAGEVEVVGQQCRVLRWKWRWTDHEEAQGGLALHASTGWTRKKTTICTFM